MENSSGTNGLKAAAEAMAEVVAEEEAPGEPFRPFGSAGFRANAWPSAWAAAAAEPEAEAEECSSSSSKLS